jgi:hypothetical protein
MHGLLSLLLPLLLLNVLEGSPGTSYTRPLVGWTAIRGGASSKRDATDDMFFSDDQLQEYEERSIRQIDAKQMRSSSSIEDLARAEAERSGNGRTRWWDKLPRVNLMLDPVVNFKTKQKIQFLGACMTVGVDYLSDLAHWKVHYSVEDTMVGGRFTLRGSELGWTKAWLWNMGLSDENTAKLKLRMGLNMNSWKMYARLRFRTEPISPFDLGEGISCVGKLPLPRVLPLLRVFPLRVEYKLRINTPRQEENDRRNIRNSKIGVSTGLDRIDISLDELNFCLEYSQRSPVLDVGLVRKAFKSAESSMKGVDSKRQPVRESLQVQPPQARPREQNRPRFDQSRFPSSTNTNYYQQQQFQQQQFQQHKQDQYQDSRW